MSKNTLNIFNVSIYNQLIHDYALSLNGLIKYNIIYEKMNVYYTSDEIHYIVEVYMNQMIDIINSKTFALFVPEKVKREILKYLPGIRSNFAQKYYNRVIKSFEKIRDLFFVKVEYINNDKNMT
jgi:hypothetical protein